MCSSRIHILRKIWRFWARADVAAILIFVVLLLAAIGSCFPQLSASVAGNAERLREWEGIVRARYGGIAGLLNACGAFHWFSAPIFLVPVALLAMATLLCTVSRWPAIWRRAFSTAGLDRDAAFENAPYSFTLALHSASGMLSLLREHLERRGFRVKVKEEKDVIGLQGVRGRLSPLATLLTHLAVLLIVLAVGWGSVAGWREEITLGPGETAHIGHAGQLMLRLDRFFIERYPDGSAAGYQAEIALSVAGQEVWRGPVRVNEPLAYRGIGIYLSNYQESAERYLVTLLVVRDPSYALIIAAGFLLVGGLALSFYFPRCRIGARIKPDGTLWVAGWAERRAWDFEGEFRSLAQELERTIHAALGGAR